MKKKTNLLFVSLLALGILFSPNIHVEAKAKEFKNCTEMNKVYKGGVAISKSTKNKGGKTKYTPFVSKELYNANKKSDRDNDGIACER